MFIGRKSELSKLEKYYDSAGFHCVIIYGRRRIGKTTLINEFIKNKDSIYFVGLESNEKENLENLSRCILEYKTGLDSADAVFSSFSKAIESVFEMAREKQIIFAVDEYPYLAESYPGISSILQEHIDKNKDNSNLYLILCGSSLSFMENQVLGYQSPLYGRRTAQFKIEPLEFFEAKNYYSGFSSEDVAIAYGITGGVPQYMSKISDKLSIEDNIKESFLDPNAYMFEEPSNLIKQECREPAQYNAIIRAIATGSSRLSEISTRVGIDSGLCSNYITKLISIGIIKKEYPFRAQTSKKTIYLISDSMFKFWYRFVPDNIALIQKNQADAVYKKIAPQIPSFMGSIFEEICKQWLWQQNINGHLPVPFADLGRWWGNDPNRKQQTEIDILAYADDDNAYFCECKWTNQKVGVGVLETLVERSNLFNYKNKFLYIFSRSGFSDTCMDKASSIGAHFFTYSEMVKA